MRTVDRPPQVTPQRVEGNLGGLGTGGDQVGAGNERAVGTIELRDDRPETSAHPVPQHRTTDRPADRIGDPGRTDRARRRRAPSDRPLLGRQVPDAQVDWNFLDGPPDGPFQVCGAVSARTLALTPALLRLA